MCSLPLQIKVGEEDFFFSPCAIMQNSTKLRNTRHFLVLVIMNGPQYSLFSFKKLLWSILHFLLYYYYIIILLYYYIIILLYYYIIILSYYYIIILLYHYTQFKKSPILTQVINYSCGCYFQLSIRKING